MSSLPCRRSQFLTGYGGVQKAGSRTPFQNSFGGETALTQRGGPRGLSVCHAGIWLWGAALAPGVPAMVGHMSDFHPGTCTLKHLGPRGEFSGGVPTDFIIPEM